MKAYKNISKVTEKLMHTVHPKSWNNFEDAATQIDEPMESIEYSPILKFIKKENFFESKKTTPQETNSILENNIYLQ